MPACSVSLRGQLVAFDKGSSGEAGRRCLPTNDGQGAVNNRRFANAGSGREVVEHEMPLQANQGVRDYERREQVLALLARSPLAVQSIAEQRRVELHAVALLGVILRADGSRPIKLR
jgi:hypothetical protein